MSKERFLSQPRGAGLRRKFCVDAREDTAPVASSDAPSSTAPATSDLTPSSMGEEDSAAVQRGEGAADRRVEAPFVLASDLVVTRPSVTRSSPTARPSNESMWLTYAQAAEYAGFSIRYLRNLVSSDAIPFYGPPRSRRFRRDVLDQFLTNRDAAMRKFRLERSSHHGE